MFKPGKTTIAGVEHELRERIILFGAEGSGKTHAWLSIANLAGDATFHVADSDEGVLRSMSRDFGHLTNVQTTQIHEFRDYVVWARSLQETVKEDDWVIVDLASSAYSKAQDYYFENKYGMTRGELEIERMLDPGHEGPLIKPDDYILIRNLFLNWWERLVVVELSAKRGAHLLATAETKQVLEHHEKKNKDTSIMRDYGELGFRPDGHKSFPHKAHTVGFLKASATGYWFTPTKDRQRDMKNLRLTESGFAIDYLMGRAGWELS